MLLGLAKVVMDAPDLDGPAESTELERRAFLLGLAGQENAWGDLWCAGRCEPAYMRGGYYYTRSKELRELTKKHGDLAAVSWGPTQILPVVAYEVGFRGNPWELADPADCYFWTVRRINMKILRMTVKRGGEFVHTERDGMDWSKMYAMWNGGTGALKSPLPFTVTYVEAQIKNMTKAMGILG